MQYEVLKRSISINLQFKICNSRKAGFTLFELTVVIFVISLMLALALPSFNNIGESAVKSDAKKLASIIRYMNDSAVSRKETLALKVIFDKKTITYDTPEGGRSEVFATLSSAELQSRGQISGGELVVFFTPLGASEAFSLILRGKDSDIKVAFNPLGGRVKIASSER